MGRMWVACAAAIGLGLLAGPVHAEDRPQATHPDWIAKPSGDDMAEAYPQLAETMGVSGHAVISCKVATTGRVENCKVTSETPPGFGFGAAALKIAPAFQMAPSTVGGSATVSDVNIPIRFVLPKPEPQASAPAASASASASDPDLAVVLQIVAAVLLTLAAIPAVAALNDRLRRRARTARIGEALARGFALVGPALRRTPIPLLIYAALVAVLQAVGPAPGPTPDMAGLGRTLLAMPLVLAGGVFAYGAAYRVAFEGRGDPVFRIRNLGLQAGGVEGRLVAAILLQLLLVLVGWAGLVVLAILSVLAARAAFGAATPPAVLAATPCLLVVLGVLASLRLNTFVAAWVAEGRERLGDSWRATRACLFPPMLISLVVAVLLGSASAGLVMPATVALEGAGSAARLGVGVIYGLLAALAVPLRVGIAAYFYEALQAPQPTTTEA